MNTKPIARAKKEWGDIFDSISDPIFVHDSDLRIVKANRAYVERASMTFEELIGRPYWEAFPKGAGPMLGCLQVPDTSAQPTLSGEGQRNEVILDTGKVVLSRAFTIRDEEGNHLYTTHILEDITEQHRDELDRLTLSEALHQSGDAIVLLDKNMRITYINLAFNRLFGYTKDELVGNPISVLAPPPDQDVAPTPAKIAEYVHNCQFWVGEAIRRARDGSLIPVYLTAAAIRDHNKTMTGYVGSYTDLRETKEAEKGVQTLREAIEDLSMELDLDTLGKKALAAALALTSAEVGSVPLLNEKDGMLYHHWPMGFPSKAVAKLKRPFHPSEGVTSTVMSAGRSQIVANYPDYEHALTEYVELGVQSVLAVPIEVAGKIRGALVVASVGHTKAFNEAHTPVLEAIARQVGIAIQRQQLMHQIHASETRFRALVETTSDWMWEVDRDIVYTYASPKVKELLGYEPEEVIGKTPFDLMPPDEARRISKLFQPIAKAQEPFAGLENTNRHKDGRLVVLETSGVPIFDTQDNFIGYRGIDRDITERKQAEQELVESTVRLKDSMIHTVQAMSHTIEERDPYTAGHQRRVAELAVALGKALQLQEDCIEGLYFSGIIHNIGYIHIPGEILSRPGKLHAAEFEIIKSHCQVGSEIVKDADLPWPVADAILQHHERLDGSGYPNGLHSETIMLEAKILAVADVVAAITSHRPYRPAQTIDTAMAEISEHRDRLYDPDTVDACVRLFRNEKFRFEQADA